MDVAPVTKKGCCCKLPRWELIVWAYIKLFLANLLLIGTFYGWMGRYRDELPVFSNNLATVVAVLDLAVTGILLFGCNKKSVKAIKIYQIISQFYLGFVAALCVYELIILVLTIAGFSYPPWQAWRYHVMNKFILMAIFGVDVCIFVLLARLIKNKKFDENCPEVESLFNKENLYDKEAEDTEEILPFKEDKLKDAVLGA